jgi:HEAT repeat protein
MEALAHSRDETAELVLLDALQTGCPEVQNAAALSLGRHPSGRAVAALSSLLTGPFGLRRINLARSAVRALAQIGRVECLPPLRALLKRRSLFRRHQAGELRVLAGEALAAIPHPDAEEILREEAASRESELSGICTRALELRQSMLAAEVGDAAPR